MAFDLFVNQCCLAKKANILYTGVKLALPLSSGIHNIKN